MIYINNHWEQVNNLQDVIRIVGEYYNDELAKIMEGLIPEHTDDEYYDLEFEISNKEDEIIGLENEIDNLQSEVERLEDKVSELEDKLSE